ncbi:MAG: type 1 glutamine amidotransferase family protein [Candidatus Sulfotelmatobacter sp.]
MKSKAYLFVFDGLADWEPALALCEIRKSGKYEVLSAGESCEPVVTMGGLKIMPDITVDEIEPRETKIFILPGGDRWERGSHPKVGELLRRLHTREIFIGALCAATLEIARAGLTAGVRHTSNGKAYLKKMVPEYKDESLYVNELAVTDQKIITASGLGSVEFAREVIRELGIYNDADRAMWFEMFKHGAIPAGLL